MKPEQVERDLKAGGSFFGSFLAQANVGHLGREDGSFLQNVSWLLGR
jgi:hypothetical protein